MRKYLPQQARADAEAYVNQLREHQLDQIQKEMDPSVSSPGDIGGVLTTMAGLFPTGQPTSVKLVGYNRLETPDGVTRRMTLEYEFPQKWLIADVTIRKKDGAATITGMQVTPLSASLEYLNRFTLKGKSVAQYAMLVLWVIAILLTLFAFSLCIRAKNIKKKWLWLIFILLGVGQVAINWTTNESSFRLFYMQTPPSMANEVMYGPWILSVSLPLGAIVFLAKRRSLVGGRASDCD